jgi:hypothetical protein
MTASGDGAVSLWKYQYPDQRKIKVGLVCSSAEHDAAVVLNQQRAGSPCS